MLTRVNSLEIKLKIPITFFMYKVTVIFDIFPGTSVKFSSVANCVCNQLNFDILYQF
jgi:hypothetical protein